MLFFKKMRRDGWTKRWDNDCPGVILHDGKAKQSTLAYIFEQRWNGRQRWAMRTTLIHCILGVGLSCWEKRRSPFLVWILFSVSQIFYLEDSALSHEGQTAAGLYTRTAWIFLSFYFIFPSFPLSFPLFPSYPFPSLFLFFSFVGLSDFYNASNFW